MRITHPIETFPLFGKTVAVPMDEATPFHGAMKMNQTAAAILELLREETTEAELVAAMAERFPDTPVETLAEDVRRFVRQLSEHCLLT